MIIDFHGFHSLRHYISECEKSGQHVDRIRIYNAAGEPFTALLVRCPTGNPDSFDGLDIVAPGDASILNTYAVRHNGSDLESVLNRHGYHLQPIQKPAAPVQDPAATEEDSGKLSLF